MNYRDTVQYPFAQISPRRAQIQMLVYTHNTGMGDVSKHGG